MTKRPDMTLHRRAVLTQQKFAHLGFYESVAEIEFILTCRIDASNGKCAYCGTVMGIKDISIDHATPLSRGGYAGWSNIVLCHKSCNRAKGDLTTEEYMRLLSFLHELGPVAEKSVLSRLKASGYAYYRR
jgi:5-methylcytosine-specific restriction endonuclease McrA